MGRSLGQVRHRGFGAEGPPLARDENDGDACVHESGDALFPHRVVA